MDMPELNRTILIELMKLCRLLARNERSTSMNAKNLAIILAGTMLPQHFTAAAHIGNFICAVEKKLSLF